MEDFEIEMGAPQGVTSDNEPDLAGPAGEEQKKRLQDSRFDPAILFAEIKASDWRADSATDAEGVDHPAVIEGGRIDFFTPVPSGGHANWSGDKGGAKAPWPFRAVKLSVEVLCPPTQTARWIEEGGVESAHNELVVAHSQMLAAIILRGTLTMEFGDITVLKAAPVSQIGAAGGAHFEGDNFGAAQNMMQAWTNAFKLPDEMIFDPNKGTTLIAWIKLNPADLTALGKETGNGWGAPFAQMHQIRYTAPAGEDPEAFTTVTLPVPYFGVRLNLWGQRGLNIRAGRSSLIGATANRR